MLTKLPRYTYIPGTPGVPAVPHRPAYRECHQVQDGHYETQSKEAQTLVPAGTGLAVAVQMGLIPAGATILDVDDASVPGWLVVTYTLTAAAWVPEGPARTICTDYPERPAVPGTPPVPARNEAKQVRAWDAGANSVDELADSVRLAFTQARVVGAVIGLTADRRDVASIDRYMHAFYFFQTGSGQPRYQVREGERLVGQPRTYAAGDHFEIQRAAGRARYLHEGLRVHESAAVSGSVSVGSALFATGDTAPGSA